jgi:translation initiation factor IF-3
MIEVLGEEAKVESPAKMEGRSMFMMLAPGAVKKINKEETQESEQ